MKHIETWLFKKIAVSDKLVPVCWFNISGRWRQTVLVRERACKSPICFGDCRVTLPLCCLMLFWCSDLAYLYLGIWLYVYYHFCTSRCIFHLCIVLYVFVFVYLSPWRSVVWWPCVFVFGYLYMCISIFVFVYVYFICVLFNTYNICVFVFVYLSP